MAVARAVRRGERVDERLFPAAAAYARGLRTAAAETRALWRWLLGFVLVVSAAAAVWDAVFGSLGNAVASAIYLAALLLEIFWWPRRLSVLLARCGEHPYGTGR